MPLSTLQFTERLGYRKENAIKMLTIGCYNTLLALRQHLESQKTHDLDDKESQVLTVVQKWTGSMQWIEDSSERKESTAESQCQRTECVFRERFCEHGRSL